MILNPILIKDDTIKVMIITKLPIYKFYSQMRTQYNYSKYEFDDVVHN